MSQITAMYKLTNFVTRHVLALVMGAIVLSLSGTLIAVWASTQAASAQNSTLLLTKAQGDSIAALTNLTRTATDLSNRLAQENGNRLKDNAALLCGGFVPLSKISPATATTNLGREIIQWAKNGALTLNCPADTPSIVPTPTPTPSR